MKEMNNSGSKTGVESLETCQRLHVLVVDDNSINQHVICGMLKMKGCTYETANNGLEALEILQSREFDLCLMDIQMPVLDGIQTAKIIRDGEKKTGKHLPIIAVTAFDSKASQVSSFEAGMDDYIPKPIRIEEFFNKIDIIKLKT